MTLGNIINAIVLASELLEQLINQAKSLGIDQEDLEKHIESAKKRRKKLLMYQRAEELREFGGQD